MLSDANDYPASPPRHALRSALFRSGLTERLGRRYWRPTDTAPYISEPYRRSVEMFAGIPTDFADPAYNAMIGPDSARWTHYHETVTAIDDCWVEPNRCHIIGPDGRLVTQSLTHRLVPMYPSALGYAARGAGQNVHEAIVYDGFNSSSYFHHLIDTLPSLALYFERSGLAPGLPLVVNRWIFDSRFFAYLRQRSPEFAGLNWLVQEPGQWLRVGRAYRIHAAPYDRDAFAMIRGMYRRVSEPNGRRVFLSRDANLFSRGLHNQREVATLLEAHGFETVFAEHLSLEAQQRTFEETTHLIALHGMGMVQQMFMDAGRGHILELMPENRLQSLFYWQSWTLGMRYFDVHSGSAMDRSGKYTIGLERLEYGVRRMLDHPADQRCYGETLISD